MTSHSIYFKIMLNDECMCKLVFISFRQPWRKYRAQGKDVTKNLIIGCRESVTLTRESVILQFQISSYTWTTAPFNV